MTAALALTPASVLPGATIRVDGTGWGWRYYVSLFLDGKLLTIVKTTSSKGMFTATVTVPAGTAPGPHNISGTSRRPDAAKVALTVRAPADAPPQISAIRAENVKQTALELAWHASEPTQAWAEYGVTTAYGRETKHELSFNYSDHRQYLAGLLAGTTYHFRIHVVDTAGQQTISPDQVVMTVPAVQPAYAFEDNFDGTALSSKWVSLYGPGDPGDRLDTDCMGDLRQVSVAGGIATLAVERKATPSGRPFAGACMSTYGTFAQKYGTFEARLRYDEAKGSWPSFFLIPVGQKEPFPEIDVFEAYGDPACLGPGAVTQAVHYAGEAVSDYKVVPVSAGWHVWKIVWTSTRLDFFIDDVLTFSNTAHVPQVAMYPIFIFGVGANDPVCRADATTPARLTMDVDYIRVTAPAPAPVPGPAPAPGPVPAPVPGAGPKIALAVGKWNVPAEAKGCVRFVTLPDGINAAIYRAAGLGLIGVIIGPYNSGGVKALNPDAFAAAAVALARANPDLVAIEQCNEPSGTWFWGSNAHGPGQHLAYAVILRKTRAAFDAAFGVGKGPKLLASFDGGYAGALQWGSEVLKADPLAYSYADAITMHPYGGNIADRAKSARGARQGVIDAHNISGKPVWITELGWPTDTAAGPTGDSLQWTEAQQAANITSFIAWAKTLPWIECVTIFMWADYPPNMWYGVAHIDQSHKPSYGALAALR